jgi:hypothetical protein
MTQGSRFDALAPFFELAQYSLGFAFPAPSFLPSRVNSNQVKFHHICLVVVTFCSVVNVLFCTSFSPGALVA